MARIAGVDLPRNKRIEIALTYIYGIGRSLSKEILGQAKVDPGRSTKDLSEDEILRIREILRNIRVEGDLRKDISMNINRLIGINTYRGTRHRKKLPARGQRTKTNARTKRGRRLTVGSGRRKETKT